ncbi:MAG: hypothetical protein V1702_05575 [Candidatus Woesearchaeota archaeon]
MQKTKLLHSPNLNTILMVENTLKNSGELMKIAELKRILPKKVMHQTLMEILDYLQLSGKILIGTKGVLWIYTEPEEMKKLMRRGVEHF